MLAFLIAAALLAGVPVPVARAIQSFENGDLALRSIGMEPETDFRRDPRTGIPDYSEGCESSAELDWELELWNTTMLKLWEKVNTRETRFTVRSGQEYLIYENFILFYTASDQRVEVLIHPEEIWTILNHCSRTPLPSTAQTSMEAWYPGLEEPVTAFITINDPAMDVIDELLQRARDSLTQE